PSKRPQVHFGGAGVPFAENRTRSRVLHHGPHPALGGGSTSYRQRPAARRSHSGGLPLDSLRGPAPDDEGKNGGSHASSTARRVVDVGVRIERRNRACANRD